MKSKNHKSTSSKKQKPMTPEDLKEALENLLKDIREFVGNGNYIFRGEPREGYPQVSSSLYRQFSRQHEKVLKLEDFKIEEVQERMLDDVKDHVKETDDNLILEQLQHYGGDTNMIDFTTDYLVALFFACEGESDKNGRLIFLDRDELDKHEMIYEPKNLENRVIAQKSIFVRPPSGVIIPDEIIPIKKELKEYIYIHLEKHHGISRRSIYNDIRGFIDRSRNYKDAYTHFHFGLAYNNEGKYEEAIKHYTKALEYDNSRPVIYNNRGAARSKNGENELALADYNKAIELDLGYALAYNNRGIFYSEKYGNEFAIEYYNKAIADFNKAIELNPDYAEAYNSRGNAYGKKKYYDIAIEDYNKAIALKPNYANAYFNLGTTYDQKGDSGSAIVEFNKAIKLNPNYSEAYANRGIAKRILQDHKGAKEDLETALQLAKKQGNKLLADRFQNSIDTIPPPDSD